MCEIENEENLLQTSLQRSSTHSLKFLNKFCHCKRAVIKMQLVLLVLISLSLQLACGQEADQQQQAPTTSEPNGQGSAPFSSDISAAIEKYIAAAKSRASAAGTQPTESALSTHGNETAREKRKLIRSRYRLRSHREATAGQQQLTAPSISNYSQPFDHQQQQESISSAPSYGNQNHYQTIGRALAQTGSISPAELPAAGSYSYVTAPAQHRGSSALGGGGDSSGLYNAIESMQVQENQGSLLDTYAVAGPEQQQHLLGRMYPPAARVRTSTGGVQRDLPYSYVAAPTSSMPSFSDYYGGGVASSFVPGLSTVGAPMSDYQHNYDLNHYAAAARPQHNYTLEGQPEFAGSHISALDYLDGGPNGALSARSRWSWPWTDVSSLSAGHTSGYPMNTAATFKKHHHHHHYHNKHKELHHHPEEHHEIMPKWEHGITIGEIVCVALAVVLGIIILGSPFFLLFLMLFNGGNLLGATQMGLLAPAAMQTAGPPTAGRRRRRRRSVDSGDADEGARKLNSAKASDLVRAGEFLLERLSPYVDAEKLMRSFERMMDVKDDIESIISSMSERDKLKHKYRDQSRGAAASQHDEMRRRKRK